MYNGIIGALIHISDILVKQYNLSLDEAIDCIVSYRDYTIFNDKETAEFFLHTDNRTWAKRMYEKKYNKFPLKANGSVCGDEPCESNNVKQDNIQDTSKNLILSLNFWQKE